jgi:hypothetical protein
VITITGVHNHHLLTASTLRYNRPSEEVKKKFFDCFDNNMNPSQARKAHADGLMKNGDLVGLADAKVNPTARSVYHMFEKWSVNNFGSQNETPIKKVQEKIDSGYYRERGMSAKRNVIFN